VANELLELKRTVAYHKLAAALEEGQERDSIIELADAHHQLLHTTELGAAELSWDTGDDQIDLAADPKGRIALYPASLSERLEGGVLPGTFIVVFGRPEAGKTLFCVNQIAGWLRDGKRVLYLSNEEPHKRTRARVRNNLAGMNKFECAKFAEEAWRRARGKGWENFFSTQLYPGSVQEIERAIEQTQPDCVVVDQMRNLQGSHTKGGTRAQTLDKIASELRQLWTKHGVVGVGTGQAHAPDGSAPKVWLGIEDFDESRTGVPGQADVMIGIGCDAAMAAHNQRALSLPKNKISGIHEGVLVTFDTQRSKVI
jgi:predicted ATP-dependent serine protease